MPRCLQNHGMPALRGLDYSHAVTKLGNLTHDSALLTRIYDQDYCRRMEEAGLRVETFDWLLEASDFGGEANRYGLIAGELLYLGRKLSE